MNQIYDTKQAQWFSTYGMLTAERILAYYDLQLSPQDVHFILQQKQNPFYKMLILPFKNIFNGIILQQAYDYEVYAQKLFVQYLLSPSAVKDPEAQLSPLEEDIEEQREKLVNISEYFNRLQLGHKKAIADTQIVVMSYIQEWKEEVHNCAKEIKQAAQKQSPSLKLQQVKQIIQFLLLRCENKAFAISAKIWADLAKSKLIGFALTEERKALILHHLTPLTNFFSDKEEDLEAWLKHVQALGLKILTQRDELHDFIVHATQLLSHLPHLKLDQDTLEKNKETLIMDSNLGK